MSTATATQDRPAADTAGNGRVEHLTPAERVARGKAVKLVWR